VFSAGGMIERGNGRLGVKKGDLYIQEGVLPLK